MKKILSFFTIIAFVFGFLLFYINSVNSVFAENNEGNNVKKIGPMINSASVSGWTKGKDLEGKDVIYFISTGDEGNFYAVDPDTGDIINSVRLEDGAGAGWGITTDPSGNVYIASDANGKLYKYDLETEEVESLGKAVEGGRIIYQVISDEDGRIYGGTYPGGELFRYDPAKDEFKNYGRLSEGKDYVRNLALDEETNTIYVGLGASEPGLVAVNLDTGVCQHSCRIS